VIRVNDNGLRKRTFVAVQQLDGVHDFVFQLVVTAQPGVELLVIGLVLALVNAIAGALAPLTRFRRHDLAAGIAVVPVLGAMLFANSLLASFFFWDPSGRTVAREVRRRGIPAGTLSVSGMKRGMQYGLSFYLRQEIKEWDAKSETGGYLLTASKNCEQVVGAQFFCEKEPFDADGTGRFLYLVIPIASGK